MINRTAIITLTRFMNQGLVVISPILLVRLLSVEAFGSYREFLLYSGLLTTLCAFGINNSLLYFIPSRPDSVRQMVRQVVALTLVSSVAVLGVTLAADFFSGGAVLGGVALPVALYVLLFVNLDFWEAYWLALKRPLPVFAYTTGRLIARITVVVGAAAIWGEVMPIVTALIALEALRLLISAIAWWRVDDESQPLGEQCWREQIRFCLPVGLALILVTLNKSMGALFVTKMLGVVALAHYAIGTYIQPVIGVLRNSVSDAVLPELAALKKTRGTAALELWKRSTVMSMILLTAAGVVLFEFAHTFVITLFSAEYEPAVAVFQIYLLVLVREVFDFGVALRAVNHTTPIVTSSAIALVLNMALLTLMLPRWGLTGAACAFLISRWLEGMVLGGSTLRAYGIGIGELARWKDLIKVAVAAALASVVFIGTFWVDVFGLAGVVLGGAAFMVLFVALLVLLRVPEVQAVLVRLRGRRAAV